MKKIYTKITMALLCLSLISISCSDFLNQVPEEKLNETILFNTREDAVKVLTTIYAFRPHLLNFTGGDNDASKYPGKAADEMDLIWNNYDWYKKDIGLYSASNPIFNRFHHYYEAIRYSMYFNVRIDECKDPKLTEEERTWWKGESNFLQAWYYFILMTSYGPLPIIDKVYNASEIVEVSKNGYPRSSMEDMIHHIDSLLETATGQLDLNYTSSGTERAGRANKVSAKFLQARLSLYAASPLYNGMVSPTTGKDYKHLCPKGANGEPLMNTTYDANKWKKALDVAEEAITLAHEAKMGLYKPSGADGYTALWKLVAPTRSGDPNIETIYYSQTDNISDVRQGSLPVSWSGYSGMNPTLEHVNEYFMANGLLPEDDVDYKKIKNIKEKFEYTSAGKTFYVPKKYTKRDPRFYVNILFPGQYSYAVLGNEVESTNTRWAYNTTSNFTDYVWFQPWYDGQDGYMNRTGRNYSINGLNIIKWTAKSDNRTGKGDYGYSIFRLADLYLMHSEAAFEYAVAQGRNPLSDPNVFKYWDMVRERAEIPTVRAAYAKANITLTKEKLRQLIRREREIEMAFEAQRYFDNRRWLIAEREGGPKHGFDIYKTEPGGFWNEDYVFETRVWNEKMYFMPINQTERDKNRQMTQNVGW